MTDEDEELDDATELLDPGSVPGMTLEEEDFAELDDATELLLFSLELLATDEEDFAELELATELLDSSLDELRMTLEEEDSAELEDATELLDPSTSLGMTLEEGGSSTLEDDSTELEETAELELLAIEEELFTLEELATDEEDSTELEEVTELLDPSLSLRMTLEDELCHTVTPPIISSSADASLAVIFVHSPFWQRRKSLPTASAAQPSSLSSQTFSPLPSARVITSPFSPFVTELEPLSSPQATRPKASANTPIPQIR